MSIFDDIAAQRDNPYLGIDIETGTPASSLLEVKLKKLSSKMDQKKSKLDPNQKALDDYRSLANSDPSYIGSLADQAESSIYQGAGRIHDFVGSGINKLFDTNIDVDPETGMSNQQLADEAAGFTGREAYNQQIAELEGLMAKENKSLSDYVDLGLKGAAAGPRVLADSANTAAELAIGTIGTGGLGLAAKGAQGVFKLFQGADKVADAVTTANKATKAAGVLPKTNQALKWMGKTTGRTSLMTLDLTESMRQDYITENGHEPSASWYAVNMPLTVALNALELGIITKLAPKFNKNIVNDMKEAVSYMSSKNRQNVFKRILRGTGKIIEGAGAEAGQEYLQSWHEIFATHVEGDNLAEISASVMKEWGLKDNEVKAALGALLGAGAGGTARGIAVAPSTAVAVTGDVAKGVAKTGTKIIDKAATKATLKVLSQEERDALQAKYEVDKSVADEKISELNKTADAVDTATSLDELKAASKSDVVVQLQESLNLTDEDLQDEGTFASLRDRVAAQYRGDAALIKTELEAKRATKVAKKIGENVVEKTTQTVKEVFKDVDVDQLIEQTKQYGSQAVRAVKGLRSSTARGLVDIALKEGPKSTKKVVKAAQDLSLDDLEAAAAVIGLKHEGLGNRLKNEAIKKRKALESVGQRTRQVHSKENLDPRISDLANEEVSANVSLDAVAKVLGDTLAGKIADVETLDVLAKAFESYKNSKSAREGTIKVLQQRLDTARAKLIKPTIAESIDELATEIEESGGLVEYLKDTTAVKTVSKVLKATGASKIIQKLKDKLPDLPDLRTDEGIEKVEQQLNETLEKVTETADKVVERTKRTVTGKASEDTEIEEAVEIKQVLVDVLNKVIKEIEANGKPSEEGMLKLYEAVAQTGVQSQEDLDALVEAVPELYKVPKLFRVLRKHFPSTTVMSSNVEENNRKADPVKDEAEGESAIEILIEGCKK